MNRLTQAITPILFLILLVCGSTTAIAQPPEGDVVLQWNRVVFGTIDLPGVHPPTVFSGRTTAMVHTAMYDAVNSIEGSHTPYLIDVPGHTNASPEAAAAKAARDVMAALFPSRTAIFDAELEISLQGIEKNRARQGQMVGAAVAAHMLSKRANDGWTASPPPFVLPTTPGNWQPTPPANAAAPFTHFGGATPFALAGSSQFIPGPPPAMTSEQYTADFNEARSLGSAASVTRTAEQTLIARIWASGPQSGQTWNNVARGVAISRGNTLAENARLFALLNITYHDSLQTTFTSKYTYGLWRPIHAIRRADEDGNPATDADPAWTSLIPSPPYPAYAGNAAAHSMGQATILAQFFGRDDMPLTVNFAGPPAATRSYPSFAELANEHGRSRIYAGIHFTFDNTAGQSAGRNVANYVFQNLLRPRCSGN